MAGNYLRKYYLTDAKLAQRARLEFFRALETGRMIAFVGSMATEHFGYGDWEELKAKFANCANAVLDATGPGSGLTPEVLSEAKGQIEEFVRSMGRSSFPDVVGMQMIEEVLDQPWFRKLDIHRPGSNDETWPWDRAITARERMRVLFAQIFRGEIRNDSALNTSHFKRMKLRILRRLGLSDVGKRIELLEELRGGPSDIGHQVWQRLGIRRFATTNYDFELERVAMIGEEALHEPGLNVFDHLRSMRRQHDTHSFDWDLGSGRIRRVYPDGWAIESDLVNRERIDRTIEFAVGGDDVNGHIIHVHGRACNWRTMIVTQRDYDALYRRNDLNRLPFEYARRMMMGGNPIMFVGLGMREEDLNRELREFISASPYQRVAPTFVLWNSNEEERDRKARRLDLLTRLGVLLVYDSDVMDTEQFAHAGKAEKLGRLIVELGKGLDAAGPEIESDRIADPNRYLRNPVLREMHVGSRWRSMKGRIGNEEGGSIVLWRTITPPCGFQDGEALSNELQRSSFLAVIGPQGCGKGAAATSVREKVADNLDFFGLPSADRCFQINGGFAFDTDTLLNGVAEFLDRTQPVRTWQIGDRPLRSRSEFFRNFGLERPAAAGEKSVALLIFNGMERFFGIDGRPLSSELDEFLRLFWKARSDDSVHPVPRIRVLLLGTERIRSYCEEIGAPSVDYREEYSRSNATVSDEPGRIPGGYLRTVWDVAKRNDVEEPPILRSAIASYFANGSGRISGDSILVRRALFDTLFDEGNFRKALRRKGEVSVSHELAGDARKVLRSLAFIGAPAECSVLESLGLNRDHAEEVIARLCAANLVVALDGYRDIGSKARPPRFALHRSLMTEMRYRFGIPLNEAKLSTAFNMSLYIAQPIDGDIPDFDIHEELGEAIDTLIGYYKKPVQKKYANTLARFRAHHPSGTDRAAILSAVAQACGHTDPLGPNDEAIVNLCSREHADALRAALALVRSYYSTTGLLTLDSGDRRQEMDRDGILLEHAERLDALIDAYGKVTLARAAMRGRLKPAAMSEIFGETEPFYPDELVWLHNERGVVRLAMGDLYETRRSFEQAMRINRAWVECEDRGHNWRRIRLNQLTLEVESGELGTAERMCEELDRLSREKLEKLTAGGADVPAWCEDELALGIALGHRGWCHNLRGDSQEAVKLFDQAIEIFARLKETRARAYFMRLKAGLPNDDDSSAPRQAAIQDARDIAQSARQMDIVHRIQVTLANVILFGDRSRLPSAAASHRANRMLEEAMAYAIQADVHRVRCEASMTIARVRLRSADFDGALRYATDAMMIATRYGMELRKISLRAVIAQIMVARGHPVTAERLARTCIKMATRKGYQTAIAKAEDVILDIPRVSASISRSDGSGLRDF